VDGEAFSLLSLFVNVAVAAPRPHLVCCLAFLDDIFLQPAVFEPSGPADVDSTGLSSVFLKLPVRTENIYLLRDRIQHTVPQVPLSWNGKVSDKFCGTWYTNQAAPKRLQSSDTNKV